MKPSLFLFAILLLAALPVGAANYVVDGASPAAGDKNPGTPEQPFKTIGAAANVAGPGDVVTIRPGVYREWVALSKSGNPDQPIVFEAEKPGTAIVSGADLLKGWTKEPGAAPIYSVAWPYDFVINTNKDGSKVRHHGAPAPVGCAEQIIWNNLALRQVMSRAQLAPGAFFVDWDKDRLFLWLPDGGNPDAAPVEGCTRSFLMSPRNRYNQWSQADFITVRGLGFRHAANFAQRGGVVVSNGWRLEDCVVEWNNAGGINVMGDDVTLERVTAQDNGEMGMGGHGKNIRLKNCVSARNNRKGFPVSWEGGGGKWVKTDGLRVEGYSGLDNTGPGLWLDGSNRNYAITGCTFAGNHGLSFDWEGAGLFLEINEGPGLVEKNTIYSNTGAGIALAESQNVTVRANTLVDNGTGIELRAMVGRGDHKLENLTVRDNKFKNWRGAAIATSLGQWSDKSTLEKQLAIDANTYDAPPGKPFYQWAGQPLADLPTARRALGVEAAGILKTVRFDAPLIVSPTRAKLKDLTIDAALDKARPGDVVLIPVNGRIAITPTGGGWTAQVFDLSNRYLTVLLPDEATRQAVEQKVANFPRSEPVFLKVKITRLTPAPLVTVLGVDH